MNYLVVGLARSGISACELLARKGEKVFAFDDDKKKVKELINLNILNQNVTVVPKLNKKVLTDIDKIILSPGVPKERILGIVKRYNILVESELELAFKNAPCDVLAITGTNGKTTTVNILGEILKQSKDVFVVGNVGEAFSGKVLEMKKNSVAVCEVSSFQLENIKTFRPKIVGFLNIAPDHLDRYLTFEEYAKAKLKIFENMKKNDVAVLNFDDLVLKKFCDGLNIQKLYFSRQPLPEDVQGAFLQDDKIILKLGNKTEELCVKDVKLKGVHNIYNIMCASIMARKYGIDLQQIQLALQTFKGLKHRLEFVGEIGNIKFFNDSKATNIHSTLTAVNSFKENIVLLLGGSDKGENFAILFENLPTNVVKIVTFGKLSKKIFSHGVCANFKNIEKAENLEDAFNKAVSNLSGDEIVLFSPAGASFDEFANFEERGEFFEYLVKGLIEWKNFFTKVLTA